MSKPSHAGLKGLIASILGIAATVAAAPPARAQAATEAKLEEILVTATRREESLSKVPVSVTAMSQEKLDQLGVKDIESVARYTPGVNFNETGTNTISIRGISSSAGAGTTGIYIDDSPIQMRSVGFNPDDTLPKTFDLDRVEVLRGPQGTLFGAGSEGGTVRYIMTQPKVTGSSTYMRSELAFTRGGTPSYELGVAHGDAISEGVLGWRGSAWYRRDGGWIDRANPFTRDITEKDANYADAVALRLAALWEPAASVRITPSIVYQNNRKHDESTFWTAYSNVSSGHFVNATPERLPVDDKYYMPALHIEADFGHSQLISNTSYYHRDETTAYQGTVYDLAYYQSLGWPSNPNTNYLDPPGLACGDTGVVPPPQCSWYPLIDDHGLHLPAQFADYQSPNQMANGQQNWTQEIRLQSTDNDSKWRWTVGAFWSQAKETSVEELKDSRIYELFTYLYGLTPDNVYGDFYNCNGNGTYTAIPACDTYYNANTTTDRQTALFGEVGYSFTDRLRLTVGDRIARMSFALQHRGDGLLNYGPDYPAGGWVTASQKETANTPKVNLSFQADPDNLYYSTIAKGFRPGGGNAPLPSYCDTDLATAGFPNGAPLTYDSDNTMSYELGTKNNFGHVLRIATSAYYIRWNNIQQNVYIAGGCGLQFTANLGTAVAKGFDLQAEMAFGPMKMDLSAGYTDARFTKTTNLTTPLANAGDAIAGLSAIGYSPGSSPPWTAALGAEYDFALGEDAAFVRADYQLQTRNNWLSPVQDPSTSQYIAQSYALPSNTTTSLRAGLTHHDWTLALFIDNLFDARTTIDYALGQPDSYYTYPNGNVVDGVGLLSPYGLQENRYTFRPRTIGLSVSYRR